MNWGKKKPNKFILMAEAAILLIVVVLGIIVVIQNRAEDKREAQNTLTENMREVPKPEPISEAEAGVEEAEKVPPTEPPTAVTEAGEPSADEPPLAESAVGTKSTGAEGAPAESAETEENVTVGALDDQEDPQAGGMAGAGEASGASVDVSKTAPGENSSTTLGIDVSKYQGTIDWAQVKSTGIEFAMIRVGYRTKVNGAISEDPTARYNMQEAQANGIKIGAYFFSSAVTAAEAAAEAEFTLNLIAKYKITYPVAYNCEDFQSADSRQYGLDNAARSGLAAAFLDKIAAAGYTPMFYASKSEMDNNALWDTDTLSGKYKIWVAQYPAVPYPETARSSYAGTHDMWQYTSQGTVAGINRKTDVNVAYFGFREEAAAKDSAPAERVEANVEVGIIFTEVNETVTAKQETNLRNEPSTNNDASIVGRLVHGDTATRTGVGHNGWSRVIYNGQTLYAVTNYLTTDMNDTGQQAPPQGPVYTPAGDRVTAKEVTNLRTVPSTADPATVVGSLTNGEVLTRIATGDNGWSQLDYNGQIVYAVSSYLQSAE